MISAHYKHRLAVPFLAVLGLAAPLFAGDAGVISAGKLSREAKHYYGQTVSVKAKVEDVVDTRTFTLAEDSIRATHDVVVLVPAGVASGLVHDQEVTVTGKVRPYVMAELKKDYDWFEDGKILKRMGDKVDLTTRPVMIATSIRTSAGTELLAANSQ